MKKIIFLYDKFINPKFINKRKLPLTFISFGFIKGKLYSSSTAMRRYSVFATDEGKRKYGNNKVYGALFVLDRAEHFLRILEGLYACSYLRLNKNHKLDIMHRKVVQFTPIIFPSLDDLSKGKYTELKEVKCIAFYGNILHPHIAHRISNPSNNCFKINSGVDAENFKELYMEVNNESSKET